MKPLAAIFPKRCVLCGEPAGDALCGDCLEGVAPLAGFCTRCGLPLRAGVFHGCGECIDRDFSFWGAVALYPYSDVKLVVVGLKFRASRLCAETMRLLTERAFEEVEAFSRFCSGCQVVVPIPLHWRRRLVREFNQVEVFAGFVSSILGIGVERLLVRKRHVRPQVGLGPRERMLNQKGSFSVRGNVEGARVLLVDDVATTLATLQEAARTLVDAGACEVRCLAFSRAFGGDGV